MYADDTTKQRVDLLNSSSFIFSKCLQAELKNSVDPYQLISQMPAHLNL